MLLLKSGSVARSMLRMAKDKRFMASEWSRWQNEHKRDHGDVCMCLSQKSVVRPVRRARLVLFTYRFAMVEFPDVKQTFSRVMGHQSQAGGS